MERRARLNLWLLAAVIVAGWLLWRDLSAPPPTVPVVRVTGLDPAQVTRLTIDREADGRLLEFEREAGRWWLRHDAERLPADAIRVGEVLRLVDAVSEANYDLATLDAREVGLVPPRARVTVDGIELRIGGQEPLKYRRYVAHGERLHLVTDTAYVHLGAEWTAFVDPAPLAGLAGLAAVEGTGWEEDPHRSAGIVDAWHRLTAAEVRPAVGPGEGATTLTFRFDDGVTRRLDAWRHASGWWLAWDGGAVRFGIPEARAATLGLD